MVETAAHLVGHVIPRVPVRQWVLSFPIPLRLLFAAHLHLLAPVLQIVHRGIATYLIQQAGLVRTEATTGAVTLTPTAPKIDVSDGGRAANPLIFVSDLASLTAHRFSSSFPYRKKCV